MLRRRIKDVEEFDVASVQKRWSPDVKTLQTPIEEIIFAHEGPLPHPIRSMISTAARPVGAVMVADLCKVNLIGVRRTNTFLLVDRAIERRIHPLRITFMEQPRKNSVTTIEAVIFGMVLSWTPCVLLMAYLLWRAPIEPD